MIGKRAWMPLVLPLIAQVVGCSRPADQPPKAPLSAKELSELAAKDPAAIVTMIAAAHQGPAPTADPHAVATAMAKPFVAVIADGEPTSGPAPLTVKFSVSNVGGVAETYLWDFGDGSPVSEKKQPRHVYERPGRYKAKLKVTNQGAEDTDTVDIQVNAPATP